MNRSASFPSAGRRSVLVAGACLALAVVALLVWFAGEGDEPEVVADAATESNSNADLANADTRRTSDAAVDAAAERSSVASAAAPVPEEKPVERTRHHVRVTVVDSKSGEPVPEAEVAADLYFEGIAPRAWLVAERRGGDRFQLGVEAGQVTKTDADGIAWVKAKSGMAICARKSERYGSRRVDFDKLSPDGIVVRLAVVPEVTVRVVDADGRPAADVPVGLLAKWADRSEQGQQEVWRLGITRANGEVSMHLDEALHGRSWPEELEAFVEVPGLTRFRAPVPATREPVVLRLPPTGSLRVVAKGPGGGTLPDLPVWRVMVNGEPPAGSPSDLGDPRLHDLGHDGEVRFPHLALGMKLNLTIYGTSLNKEAAIAGPGRSGEQVEYVFDMSENLGFAASGRLLDEAGAPLADVRAMFREPSGGVDEAQTDADGRFLVRIRYHREASRARIQPWALLADGRPVQFDAFELTKGRLLVVGDLRAKPCQKVATGEFVVDGPMPLGLYVGVNEEGAEAYPGCEAVIAEDRTFTLWRRAGTVTGPLKLVVRATGFAQQPPMPFSPGAHLRVELRRGVYFSARIQLDPAILSYVQQHALDLVMSREGGERTLLRGNLVEGEFVFESATLAEGMYRVAVESGNASDDLAQMEAVRLVSGQPTDPRLQPWDLRSSIQLRTLRLRKPDGSVLDAYADVMRRRAEDGTWENCASISSGVGQCITTMVPSDLLVSVREHGWFLQRQVLGDLELVVPEPHRFRIVFDGMPAIDRNAPVFVRVRGDAQWSRSQGIPDEASYVIRTEWNRETGTAEVLFRDSGRGTLTIEHRVGDQRIPLLQQDLTLEQGKPELHVQVPPSALAALQTYAQPAGVPR